MKTFFDFKKQIANLHEEDQTEEVFIEAGKNKDSEQSQDMVVSEPKDVKKEPEKDVVKDTGSTEWTKTSYGWVVRFKVGGTDYTAVFSPLDEQENHWKFTYYKTGQRNSSDIKKFGKVSDWVAIWSSLNDTIKDFLRVFRPHTLKYIGMSISKRQIYYRELFKIFVKHFLYYYRSMGYQSSFDQKDLNLAPTFIVRKRSASKDKSSKEKDTKNEKE